LVRSGFFVVIIALAESAEVTRIVQVAQRATGVDLEALELAIGEAALQAGAHVFEVLLRDVGVGRREHPVRGDAQHRGARQTRSDAAGHDGLRPQPVCLCELWQDPLPRRRGTWSVPGANAIIALRCTTLSNCDDDFWEQRAA